MRYIASLLFMLVLSIAVQLLAAVVDHSASLQGWGYAVAMLGGFMIGSVNTKGRGDGCCLRKETD